MPDTVKELQEDVVTTNRSAAPKKLRGRETAGKGRKLVPPDRRRPAELTPEMLKKAAELEAELKGVINGEVRFDDGNRGMYSTDGSNYRQVPIGVVIPRDEEDVIQTVALCRKYLVPITMRAGGTSLAGQTTNTTVVIDCSKYLNDIIELNPDEKYAWVHPGLILDDLRDAAEKYNLTFAPDPATHSHNCLGGMIGNNSCGVHSVMGGTTVDNILELDVLTYDGLRIRVGPTSEEDLQTIISEGGRRGEIYGKLKSIRDRYAGQIREKYPDIPRRVSGYNLNDLLPECGFDVAKALVGSEGTCVVVLRAKCRLVYSPPVKSLLVLGYPDVFHAGDHVMEVLEAGPIALEGIDDRLISDMKKKGLHPEDVVLVPEGAGWLMVEFGGESKEEADSKARKLMEKLKEGDNPPSMKLFDDAVHEKMIWQIRESGLGATANVPGSPLTWEGWEDSAVPPEKTGPYLRDLRKLLDKYGYMCDLYGHFGQGCIHTRIDFDFFTEQGIAHYRKFMDEATDLVLSYGGSFSGEHGDGQSRAEFLPKMFGDELIEAFDEFKRTWDPMWKMNPGKIVHPYRIDQNLRLGINYDPPQPETYFSYPDDHGSWPEATLRCVGVGNCRRTHGGTMCPSFMVTREEAYSTRGRARLLFEMMQGNPMQDGWKSEAVKDALDYCLSCKGCKGDCPVNVDMATYKAEFLSHYYDGRLRPANAYAFGLIFKWARLAEMMPAVANFVTHAPVLNRVFKWATNIAPERDIPTFAPETFKSWWKKRPVHNAGKTQVILWADTFNNYFYPRTARAAVDVLEHAGFQVIVPEEHLCCGRPLYDYGMLDAAQAQLMQIIKVLRPHIRAGVPVVGLEPSCIATFRDELLNLFPNDEDARRLSRQSFMLTEFLAEHAPDYEPPTVARKAMVHIHCHHKSVLKQHEEEKVMKKMGMEPDFLDTGCCGMAGGFGFEKEHYEVSMKCGERVLLPAVRGAEKNMLIIADGFSCREQICQTTDRQGLHLAEVMQLALKGDLHEDYPEEPLVRERDREMAAANARALAVAGVAAVAIGAVAWWLSSRRRE